MATWIVKTHFKKSCAQYEYFTHPDYEEPIKVEDGFRRCTFEVTTSDDELPAFEFAYVPGGDGKKDSINVNSCCDGNIESSDLIELFDGGCFGNVTFPDDMDEDEQERLEELIDNEGSYALEEEGNDWTLDETEIWVWGPIEICNEQGEVVKIICADSNGVVSDFIPKQ